MWAFFSRRLRTFLLAVVLAPVVAVVARRLAERVERAHPEPTVASRGLRLVESAAGTVRRVLR
ncbi:hypothetical protein [Cellulomonas biazotea]|jgi:hypothetical protein|uniref:Uncharacterized protein n=1 Tax=Cellulomonas biazotea TaxID=1709 RepID=A0A402DLF0_9CELL|nr:hypothetical protein [Cellulomonas biazotea]GCE74956.1 hypothetical protein CBZ_00120 [Cellulomonas biazotea]